jgi:hypothetical protein
MFYTYLWLRDDGTPYYVGKGKLRRAMWSYGHRVRRPVDSAYIILQEWEDEQDALEAEKFLIGFYGRANIGTGCLRNLTDGGEGISNPPFEVRQKIRIALTGNKNGLGNKGGGRQKGFTMSLEHREKIRRIKQEWATSDAGRQALLNASRKAAQARQVKKGV